MKLFVFWILGEAKQLSRSWWRWRDRGVGPPCSCPLLSSLSLTPTSSLHSLSYSSCSCSLVALSHSVIKSFSLSFSICPWDTKMDGEAPGMGSTIDCATRWAASAAYGSVLPFLAPARLLTRLEYVCVKGGLNGTVWQQMLLFGQKSERGLGWGA